MPAASALAPSMTQSTPEETSRPRATRSAKRAVTTVLFSVSPSHSPTGTLVPSAVMTRATTTHEPATSSPSIMSTATSRSERSRAISSPMALVVAATKRRETADLDMRLGACLELCSDRLGHVDVASGGHPGQHALDDERVEQVGRAERLPGVEFDLGPGAWCGPEGARCSTWRPPRTTEPLALPCQFPTRSAAGDLGVLRADRLGQLRLHHLYPRILVLRWVYTNTGRGRHGRHSRTPPSTTSRFGGHPQRQAEPGLPGLAQVGQSGPGPPPALRSVSVHRRSSEALGTAM